MADWIDRIEDVEDAEQALTELARVAMEAKCDPLALIVKYYASNAEKIINGGGVFGPAMADPSFALSELLAMVIEGVQAQADRLHKAGEIGEANDVYRALAVIEAAAMEIS